MNQKLKFAFATVITLLAVLWICYCVFCGFVYLHGSKYGDDIMWRAAVASGVCFLVLTSAFIGVQLLKATDHKFSRFIIWERIFMLGICPICFLVAGYYYSHFFTVHAQGEEAKTMFIASVQKSERIFNEYRSYVDNRVDKYRASLYGDRYKKENKVHVLQTYLQHPAITEMEKQCTNWIKDVHENVTVWNPFLLGNIPYIQKAITDWHAKLKEFSDFKMTDEYNAECFDNNRAYIQDVLSGLDKTQQIYATWQFPNFWAILTAVLCYTLMIFTYFIQERNTRNLYRLFSNPRKTSEDKEFSRSQIKRQQGPIVGDF